MKRRLFFKESTSTMAGISLAPSLMTNPINIELKKALKACVTMDQENVSIYSDGMSTSLKVIHIADTHLFRDDQRGQPYRQYSGRMAKAYNQTNHYKTGEQTNPEESFTKALEYAKNIEADLITLIGDIFSFPSEAAIEWVVSKIEEIGIPYIYVAGNHDWHYEGMEGSLESLRDTWINNRLLPLYQGNNPLMASYGFKGVRFLAIDNSTYQINEQQLEFFREQVKSGEPLVLLVHIPMYAPGREISFGCGNPNWCAANDRIFEIERRPKWPETGHNQTTYDFHKEVFNAPNLLGIFCGHTHNNSMEIINGKPQIVADDNASGAYLDIDLMPIDEKDKTLVY